MTLQSSQNPENPYEAPQVQLANQHFINNWKHQQTTEHKINLAILLSLLISLIVVFFSEVVIEHVPPVRPSSQSIIVQYDYLTIIVIGRVIGFIAFLICAVCILTRNHFACLVASVLGLGPIYMIYQVPKDFHNPTTLTFVYYLWLGSFIVLELLSITECYRGFTRSEFETVQ